MKYKRISYINCTFIKQTLSYECILCVDYTYVLTDMCSTVMYILYCSALVYDVIVESTENISPKRFFKVQAIEHPIVFEL